MFAEQGRGERVGPGGDAERINALLFAPSIDDSCGDVRKMQKKLLQQTLHSEYFEGHEEYRESGINIDSERRFLPTPRKAPQGEGRLGLTEAKHLKPRLKSLKSRVRSVLLIHYLCFFVFSGRLPGTIKKCVECF